MISDAQTFGDAQSNRRAAEETISIDLVSTQKPEETNFQYSV
jgi:hypothetical protein